MRTAQSFIALPPERAAMLRQLAAHSNLSIGDLIGELIIHAVENGCIEDRTTGVRYESDGRRLAFCVDASDGTTMVLGPLGPDSMRRLARIIEDATERTMPGGQEATAGATKLMVARIGTGIAFVQDDHRRVVAYAVAGDIVRQLRKGANELEAMKADEAAAA